MSISYQHRYLQIPLWNLLLSFRVNRATFSKVALIQLLIYSEFLEDGVKKKFIGILLIFHNFSIKFVQVVNSSNICWDRILHQNIFLQFLQSGIYFAILRHTTPYYNGKYNQQTNDVLFPLILYNSTFVLVCASYRHHFPFQTLLTMMSSKQTK